MKNFLPLQFLITSTFLILISNPGFGQEPAQKQSRIQIEAVYVTYGFTNHRLPTRNADSFRKLAPGSEILDQDFATYGFNAGLGSTGSFYFTPSLSFRFNRADGSVNNHFRMRAGLSYTNGQMLYQSAQKSTRIAYDTLVSTITGEVVIRDSVQSENIGMSYQGSSLQIDLSVLWSTDFEARFQVYAGVGVAAGVTFNNRTTITNNSFLYDSEHTFDRTGVNFKSEQYSNKAGFSGNAYLPLGLDWRLGKEGFWEAIHLLGEFRPGIAFYTIPELDSYVSPSFGFVMGIKVGW